MLAKNSINYRPTVGGPKAKMVLNTVGSFHLIAKVQLAPSTAGRTAPAVGQLLGNDSGNDLLREDERSCGDWGSSLKDKFHILLNGYNENTRLFKVLFG